MLRENSSAYYIQKNINRETQWGYNAVQECDKEKKNKKNRERLCRQASKDLCEESMELVGRQKEMATIADFRMKKTATILHITGKPGTGKNIMCFKISERKAS